MSDLSILLNSGSKVVISPDKMRAWISLVRPPKGVHYTAQAIGEWLFENGVIYGSSEEMIQLALAEEKYDDLLEVARGRAAVSATAGDYKLLVEQKPFTGLRGGGDGSIIYDDLSFLQQAEAGQALAEVIHPTEAQQGMTVTGEAVYPREGSPGRLLEGTGFALSADGNYYIAPTLSHINIVNGQLIVTPLVKLESLSADEGEFVFDGNVLVEGDITLNAAINATGSVFIVGRAVSAKIKAGNNVLLSNGMRNQGGFGVVEAKGHVWGLFFESTDITAGGDVYATHMIGCEVWAGGRVIVAGGRALVASTNLYAKGGVVAGTLGDGRGDMVVAVGMEKEFLDRYNAIISRDERLNIEVRSLQQNIATHERINKTRPDKGRGDTAYQEMIKRRNQLLSTLTIIANERSRMKRTVDQFSTVTIIAREVANPGVSIVIDTRSLKVTSPMPRTKFRRDMERISVTYGLGR